MADSPFTPPPVKDARTTPPGILPKNIQNWIFAGIALIMILVLAFTGGNNPPKKPQLQTPANSVVVPNVERIQEYQKRIDEETRKLHLEQAQLAQAQLAQARQTLGTTGRLSIGNPEPYAMGATAYGEQNAERESFRLAKERRDYESLFASNIALSYRKDTSVTTPSSSAQQAPPSSLASAITADALAKILPMYGYSSAATPQTAATPSSPPPAPAVQSKPNRYLDDTDEKTYRLFEGSFLETVLTNRLDGSFSGPVNCMVTTDVYSRNGRHILIPQGSRVLGEVEPVETFGQERLAVFFHRLILPNGHSASLDRFQGLNQIGETGLRDRINHHYLQVFGVSIAIGALAGLGRSDIGSQAGPSGLHAYEQGVADSLSQSSLRILDRYLNVLPTFTIREGHRVKIYLSGDLDLPAYDKHNVLD